MSNCFIFYYRKKLKLVLSSSKFLCVHWTKMMLKCSFNAHHKKTSWYVCWVVNLCPFKFHLQRTIDHRCYDY
jgi:hypothetical protein